MNPEQRRALLAQDITILELARAVLARHDHGIPATCDWGCALTPDERRAHLDDTTPTGEIHLPPPERCWAMADDADADCPIGSARCVLPTNHPDDHIWEPAP